MKQLILLLLVVAALGAVSAKAAQVDSPAPPTSPLSALYSLEDVYNRLSVGTPGALRTGGFTDPTTGPVASRHTLNDVMNAAPANDSNNGASAAQVLASKTFWSLLPGKVWGPATGTMPNNGSITLTPSTASQIIALGFHDGTGTVLGDVNLISANIRAGVNIFGVAGSPSVVDTSTGTATAGDIASGKIAFVNGVAFTGTLSSLPLNGDVTGTTNANTVATVGGVTAANVASGANAANAATTASLPNTIVMRDNSGNILGTVAGGVTLSGDVTGNSSSNTVGAVGGVTATNVASGANAANAATNLNTINTIVMRDASGNFSAGTVNVAGAIGLPATSSSTTGLIIQNGSSFIHSFGTNNYFAGTSAGNFSLSGGQNTGVGKQALSSVTSGGSNAAFGAFSLQNLSTGSNNVSVGQNSGTGITTGVNNIALGNGAGSIASTGSNDIYVGNGGAAESNTIRIGTVGTQTNAFLAGIVHADDGISVSKGSAPTFIVQARPNNTGASNVFIGNFTGSANTTGSSNTFVGTNSGTSNITNQGCTFVGTNAGTGSTADLNTAVGCASASAAMTGGGNSFFGHGSGFASTSGTSNTFMGQSSGFANTSGSNNVFLGQQAGTANTTGSNNIAIGMNAGNALTTSSFNIYIGNGGVGGENFKTRLGTPGTQTDAYLAGVVHADDGISVFRGTNASFIVEPRPSNAGVSNIFIGSSAGVINTSGTDNTFMGTNAGSANTTFQQCTFIGSNAGVNSAADYNTAVGSFSGIGAMTGNSNAFFGQGSGNFDTTGSSNVFLGRQAGFTNTTGSNNIAIGTNAGNALTTGSNNIEIGNAGVAAESNVTRIGSTQTAAFMAGVSGATSSGGTAVFINGSGQLGTVTSSRRYKDNILPMGEASSKLLTLNPVTFTYKKELDPKALPQFGLIAEEVAKVNPDWVVYNSKGEVNSVRYEQINAMLLNEFLKDHKKVEDQAKMIDALSARLTALEAQVGKK